MLAWANGPGVPPPFPKPCRGVTTYLAPTGLMLSYWGDAPDWHRVPRWGTGTPLPQSKTARNVVEKNG
jgi:hypothetical protein